MFEFKKFVMFITSPGIWNCHIIVYYSKLLYKEKTHHIYQLKKYNNTIPDLIHRKC